MARGSQDRSRDEQSASDLEYLLPQGYGEISFHHMDPVSDRHPSSPWEGQQNFHSHSGENGNPDSYESVPMLRNSHVRAVPGIDARSLAMDASWSVQDTPIGATLQRWLAQSSHEATGSPPTSLRTVTPDHPAEAQSVELRPSLSQMSHNSGMTDRSFSLPDTGVYPNNFDYNADNQLYSESKYIDEMDSSVGQGSYHNGDTKGSRRQSQLMLMANGSSYPAYTSPEEVMFTSPMDVMSQAMFESNITHDGISAAMDPLTMNDSLWAGYDPMDQPESEGSTPYSSDMTWPTRTSAKTSLSYSPTHATNSPRASRKAMVQQNGRVNGDHSSGYQPGFYDALHQSDRGHSHGSVDNDSTPREHPLYLKPVTGPDGLYHCPWEGRDPACNHKPEKLKCNYDKFVDSHLKPYRCKNRECENARFSSTACLLRHEREAHAMHGHGEKPFLCTFEGCDRGVSGNGFPRHWNLCDHMKRVHNRSPSPSSTTKPSRGSKKRKNSAGESSSSKKSPNTTSASVNKPRAPVRSMSLTEQFQQANQQLLSELMEFPDLGDVEAAEQRIEKANQYLKQMARATQQMRSVPKMERTISHQSS